MVVTSTQFQQNIGKYFDLVDAGKSVTVRKKRPMGYEYKLIPVGVKNSPLKFRNRSKEILKNIEGFKFKFDFDGNGLQYQDKVRS